MTITTHERLAQLTKESATLDTRRNQAQQEVDTCSARMESLAQRASAIHVATTTLAHLAPLAPEQKWLAHLTTWRKRLCDELLAVPRRNRDRVEMDRQQNLTFSIRLIDFGLGGTLLSPFLDLSSLRVGELMAEAGYATSGPELRGPRGWLGSIPEVKQRIEDVTKQRAKAQAALDDALMTDEERATHEAEDRVFRETLNTMDIRINDDPNVPGLVAYTKDGDVLTESEMTAAQRKAFERHNGAYAPHAVAATVAPAPDTTITTS